MMTCKKEGKQKALAHNKISFLFSSVAILGVLIMRHERPILLHLCSSCTHFHIKLLIDPLSVVNLGVGPLKIALSLQKLLRDEGFSGRRAPLQTCR